MKQNSPNGDDGDDWNTAFDDLQDALAEAAGTPGPDIIWVAAGTYTPTPPGGGPVCSANVDRTVPFGLRDRVEIYGP